MLNLFTRPFKRAKSKDARGNAMRLLSVMVGAVVLAREVEDEQLSDEILLEARRSFQ